MTIRLKIAARHLALAICLSPAAPASAETFAYSAQFGNNNSNSSQNLNYPQAVALYGGDIFVADGNNNRIAEYTTSGTFVQAFGTSGSGTLSFPLGVAVNSSGDVFVANNNGAGNVVEFNGSTGAYIQSFGGTQFAPYGVAQGIALDSSGDVYVTNSGSSQVYEYNSSGTYLKTISSGISGPAGIAVSPSGNLYVANSNNATVTEYSSSGTLIATFGNTGSKSMGKLSDPLGITVDSSGNVYVSDSDISVERIVEYTSSGAYLTSFGSNGTGNGQLSGPAGLAVDSSGNVYIADSYNNRIEVFAPVVPEPGSLLMLGMGGVATAVWAAWPRRRGHRRS